MTALKLLPFFIVGLLGSVHCAGMCGGIVSAFSAIPRASRPFPLPVSSVRRAGSAGTRVLAYNSGRIASYTTAGALAGALAGQLHTLSGLAALQSAMLWLANAMLLALGLYLMDAWRGLARLEALGQHLWTHLRPLMGPLMPLDRPHKLLALGLLWGWLPCGMVYSVLVSAMLSGSAANGAGVMLAFGLGTLPVLLALGLLGEHLRTLLQRRALRRAAGALVLGFGLLGMLRIVLGAGLPWLDAVCLAGAHP
ncbi:MAG: sulfite exporter TauE/SafE family protein [Pseudomonadota bacterium]